MPTAKETRVRVEALVEDAPRPPGARPAGAAPNGSAFEARGQVEDLGLLGGGEVVVAEEVAERIGWPDVDGWSRPRRLGERRALVEQAGQGGEEAVACSSVRTSGGASRTRPATALLTR